MDEPGKRLKSTETPLRRDDTFRLPTRRVDFDSDNDDGDTGPEVLVDLRVDPKKQALDMFEEASCAPRNQ